MITEATVVAEKAGGFFGVPGIWSDEQIAGWKKVSYLLTIDLWQNMH
jgi:NADPH2 dehydrogenase